MQIFEPNQKQNLVVLMEPPIDQFDISLKGGNMILNRFCIDEDAAFELSEVHYFKKSRHKNTYLPDPVFDLKIKKERRIHSGDLTLFCKL